MCYRCPNPSSFPAQVTGGKVTYAGADLLDLEPDERARAGVFLAFQYPVEIPGVSNSDFLRLSVRRSGENSTGGGARKGRESLMLPDAGGV
jgi:Fe-S cluster assembly ATPase SufC